MQIKIKKNRPIQQLDSGNIKVNNLSFSYMPSRKQDNNLLHDLSFEIEPGKITAIIGETGSGKSTLIQFMNALLKPQKGTIEIGNTWLITSSKKKIKDIKSIRKNVGMVFQFAEYQLFQETIYKDIIFGPKNMGIKDEEELKRIAKEKINLVNLPESYLSSSPFELSGGQKRRVAIASILSMQPKILILDEPTAGLDPEGEELILNIIKRLVKKDNVTIVLITHNMDHVLKMAQRVLVLKEGRLIANNTPVNIFSDEKLIKESNMGIPMVFSLRNKLIKKGFKISKNVKDHKQLAKEIAKNLRRSSSE